MNEYRESVLTIFGLFSAAVDAMVSCQGVSRLLHSYCRLCHVTMMNQEGSAIVSKLLDQKQQCQLLQAGQDAWQDSVAVCVSNEQRFLPSSSSPLGTAPLGTSAPAQPSGSKRRTSWRPDAVATWQKCVMCLSLVHSYIALSNMAVASRGDQMTSTGPRLRREPSFAQLAGPDEDSSTSHVRPELLLRRLICNASRCYPCLSDTAGAMYLRKRLQGKGVMPALQGRDGKRDPLTS